MVHLGLLIALFITVMVLLGIAILLLLTRTYRRRLVVNTVMELVDSDPVTYLGIDDAVNY